MKSIINKIVVVAVALGAMANVSAINLAQNPQRSAKCLFAPDKYGCSLEEVSSVRKQLAFAGAAVVGTIVAAALSIGIYKNKDAINAKIQAIKQDQSAPEVVVDIDTAPADIVKSDPDYYIKNKTFAMADDVTAEMLLASHPEFIKQAKEFQNTYNNFLNNADIAKAQGMYKKLVVDMWKVYKSYFPGGITDFWVPELLMEKLSMGRDTLQYIISGNFNW